MARQKRSQKPLGDEIGLAPEDDEAIDEAWRSITDADISDSIRWLNQIEHNPPPPKEKQFNG